MRSRSAAWSNHSACRPARGSQTRYAWPRRIKIFAVSTWQGRPWVFSAKWRIEISRSRMAIGLKSTGRSPKNRSSRAENALVNPAVLDFRSRGVLGRRFRIRGFVQASDFVAVEIHSDAARVDVARAALLEIINVIPTFVVEAVGHHGRSQEISDLAARHAFFDGIDRALIEEIALLYVDAVDATRSQQRQRRSQKKTLNYFHESGEQ